MQVDSSMTYTRDQVVANLRKAASLGPVSFDFLLRQAEIESGLNPDAKAATSSAAGPFQFINGTWLQMVARHGDSVGLSEQAAALRENRLDDSARSSLLALRNDIQISTKLAAHFALDNANSLAAAGHPQIGATELYLAHFLGAGGAAQFLSGMRANPNGSAADVLPDAARANKNVFFDNATPRSFIDIYNRFSKKFIGIASPVSNIGAQNVIDSNMTSSGIGENVDPALAADLSVDRENQKNLDFDVLAKKILNETRAARSVDQRIRAENTEYISATESNLEHITELSEAALSNYLKSFSKSVEDPTKATLGESEAASRDASRGAVNAGDAIETTTVFLPPTVTLGARILMDATVSNTVDTEREQRNSQLPQGMPSEMSPAVRQAVQWVSLFSDPRGSDRAQPGRV